MSELPPFSQADARDAALTVVGLFRKWELQSEDARRLLGGISAQTYAAWQAGEVGEIDEDLFVRLGNLLGIHAALRSMFMELESAYSWVKRPNQAYGGETALAYMLDGGLDAIVDVRQYLDAELY